MIERKLFNEIPGRKNDFHSAVLTSFSFDFQYFENRVLTTLKQKWISSINILTDQRMLDNAFEISIGKLKNISQSYVVTGIESKGAFHPKINFFIGYDSILVLYGSGNLTPGGHGKNYEFFAGFYADKDNKKHLELILEAWEYLLLYSNQLEGYTLNRIRKDIPSNCNLLTKTNALVKHKFHEIDNKFEVALLYNEETNIFSQLVNLITIKDIQKITIICPYYDEDGEVIKNIINNFTSSKVEIFLQKEFGLPPTKFPENERVEFYNFDKTNIGKKTLNNNGIRRLHSKIFHFKSEKEEYCLIGSANATISALGSFDKRPVNNEFCALYKSSSYHFLEEFGLIGTKEKIKDINSLERVYMQYELMTAIDKQKRLRIKSIDLEGKKLKVYFSDKISTNNLTLLFFNLDEEKWLELKFPQQENTSTIEFSLKSIPNIPLYCTVVDKENNIISNKQLINDVYKLHNTSPNKQNRQIQEIINNIETGSIFEFQLIDFFYKELLMKKTSHHSINSGSKHKNVADKVHNSASLTYEDASKIENKNISKIINTHYSTILWKSIMNLFKLKNSLIADEQTDEEEEASSTESRERKQEAKTKEAIDYKKINFNSISKMVESYISYIKNKYDSINIIDYQEFLLVSYILSHIYLFNDYKMSEEERKELNLKSQFQFNMLKILNEFACLHIRKEITVYEEDNYLVNRMQSLIRQTVYHIFIYGTIILNNQKKYEIEIENKIYIYLLNIINKCGIDDKNIISYVENFDNSLIKQVLKITKTIKELLPPNNENYINYKSHGICYIKERGKDKSKLVSLLSNGLVNIPNSKIKKEK